MKGYGVTDEIVITEWALQSYLDLRHGQVFADTEYQRSLRPDALLLLDHPTHPRFANGKFWGPAKHGNKNIQHGWKMKWRQIGNGKVQLRLLVVLHQQQAFLCNAYVKDVTPSTSAKWPS